MTLELTNDVSYDKFDKDSILANEITMKLFVDVAALKIGRASCRERV